MPTMKEILNRFSLNDLKQCTKFCLLPDSGSKSEVISTLIQGFPPSQADKILMSFLTDELKKICRIYGLPVSGARNTLIERILEITTIPARTDTARKKCQMCGHLFDQRMLHQHHFIPKSVALTQWEDIGGVILLCSNCHSLFHRRQDEETAKKRSKLVEDEIRKLFKRTQREVKAGKYGRK